MKGSDIVVVRGRRLTNYRELLLHLKPKSVSSPDWNAGGGDVHPRSSPPSLGQISQAFWMVYINNRICTL